MSLLDNPDAQMRAIANPLRATLEDLVLRPLIRHCIDEAIVNGDLPLWPLEWGRDPWYVGDLR